MRRQVISVHLTLKFCCNQSYVFVSSKEPTVLKRQMDEVIVNICEWVRANKLTVNADKTTAMWFNTPETQGIANNLTLKMCNNVLQFVPTFD